MLQMVMLLCKGDIDSRPSKGEPAWGRSVFLSSGIPQPRTEQTGSRRPADRKTDRQPTDRAPVIGSRAKAKDTAASCLCSAASPFP